MSDHATLFAQRRTFSRRQLKILSNRLNVLPELKGLPGLCVYATGSYARNEASTHSDIDLFFVHPGSSDSSRVSRLRELRMFARVIEIGEQMKLPTFSNDGEYLQILYLDDMLAMLGGRSDDYANYFTARMLLLLESSAVLNEAQYRTMIRAIVKAYFRDYPHHAVDFRPVFLINDILRFWKTLCLNYEHRRNKPDNIQKRKQQVKNFKLKFSRLMSCFGTIIAVCSKPAPITMEHIVALTATSPLDRFVSATDGLRDLREVRRAILDDYEWFMNKTALTSGQLTGQFGRTDVKTEMFRRADVFGERMYHILDYFAKRNKYSRYLVI